MSMKTKRMVLAAGLLGSVYSPTAPFAQSAPQGNPPAVTAADPSDSAMVNLVRLLILQKVLTPAKGQELIAQAEAEASAARKSEAGKLAAAVPAAPPALGDLPPPAAGVVRVAYVPETVREAIKADLRREVIEQARAEGWAAKGEAAPEWTRRISISGDVRVRSQSGLFSKTNSNQILNYALINQSGPYNLASTTLPYINTRRDVPNLLQLRARFNIIAKVSNEVDAGFQLATGDDNSPISTNASLGGGFAKRNFWLQQAWFKYHAKDWGSLTLGRMPNPFQSTELVFDEDLAFDGVSAELDAHRIAGRGVDFKLRGGAFPLDFGDINYLSSQSNKTHFPQKYLFSVQGELDSNLGEDLKLRFAAAYHHFTNVQGQLSQPCFTGDGAVDCSTDGLRPFALRKGNTLSLLRQLAVSGSAPLTAYPQYFGLTFNYHLVNVNAVLDYDLGEDRRVQLSADYVRNIAWRASDICRNGVYGEPFNNGGSEGGTASICDTSSTVAHTKWTGGRDGWQVMARIGSLQPWKRGQWLIEGTYRRVGTDAVLDSFTDSDFHLGGTNAKGYILGGKLAVFDNVALGAKWYSANQITAEPLHIDVLQVDLSARF